MVLLPALIWIYYSYSGQQTDKGSEIKFEVEQQKTGSAQIKEALTKVSANGNEYARQNVAGVDGAFVLSQVLTEDECYELKQGIIKLHQEAAQTRTAKFAE